MDAIAVVLTLILLVALIIAIVKKFNILATLTFLTFIGFAMATVLYGASTMGEAGSGNMWIDIFEQFRGTFSATLAGNGLLIMVVMGTAGYFSKIKASDMFAGLVAIPISKIKAKWLLIAIAPLIGLVFQIIIPSGMGAFVVALSTIYPILVAVGVNPVTAALALLFGCNVFTGPANPFVAMCIDMMGLGMNVSDFFFQYGMIPVILVEIVIGIVMVFWSSICDKKDGAAAAGEVKKLDINELGVPKFYAILPLIPIIFIVIFSSFATGGQFGIITVPAAYTIGFVVAVIVHVICTKGNKKEIFGEAGPLFYDEMGGAFAKVVSVVGLGTFFSAALTALGGIDIIMNVLVNSLGLGFWPMLVVFLVLYFIMALLAGPTLSIPLLAPAITVVATSAGMADLLPMAAVILTLGGGLGLFLMPYDPKLLMVSQMNGIDIMQVIKRTAVPAIIGSVACFVICAVMYAVIGIG